MTANERQTIKETMESAITSAEGMQTLTLQELQVELLNDANRMITTGSAFLLEDVVSSAIALAVVLQRSK
jgi:hypothetical protein